MWEVWAPGPLHASLHSLHPLGLRPKPGATFPNSMACIPPAAVESGASRGLAGAARHRFRPVTETLATLGQAEAVVSASRDSRTTLLETGWPARDQVGPGLPTWWPRPLHHNKQVLSAYCVQGRGEGPRGRILIPTPSQSSESWRRLGKPERASPQGPDCHGQP